LARSIEELVELRPVRERAVGVLFHAGESSHGLGRITANANDRLVRRILALVEQQIGPPPVAYCWLGMGSEGRREQTLLTDQDNALVYQDMPVNSSADPGRAGIDPAERYFADLAERAAAALERCGFPRCDGGVMASNPAWCRPLSAWRGRVDRWVREPKPEETYNAAIFCDLRPIAGDSSLADALWTDLLERIPHSSVFVRLLLEAALILRPPLGPFGRLPAERSRDRPAVLHLKLHGLLRVVGAVRAAALACGISCTNTFERLTALRELGAMSRGEAGDLMAAYDFVMRLRLRHQLDRLAAGQPVDDFIVLDRLPHGERRIIEEHLQVIAELPGLIDA
jgi:CBS domain-containing protein